MRKCVKLYALWLSGALLLPGTPATGSSDGGSNLLANPGFESGDLSAEWPAEWIHYASRKDNVTATRDAFREGVQAIQITAQGIKGAFQGVTQRVPVKGGQEYSFTVHLLNDRKDGLGGSAFAQLVVEWRDEAGREIKRQWGGDRGPTLSRTRWESVSLQKLKAPEGAIEAIVGVHLFDGDRGGKGGLLIDDASFVER